MVCDALGTALDTTDKLESSCDCVLSEMTEDGDFVPFIICLVSKSTSSGKGFSFCDFFEADFMPTNGHTSFCDSLVSGLVENSVLAPIRDCFPFWNGPQQKFFCDILAFELSFEGFCDCLETEMALKWNLTTGTFGELLLCEPSDASCCLLLVCFVVFSIASTSAW